jgi:hypothetical protein
MLRILLLGASCLVGRAPMRLAISEIKAGE